MAIPADEAAERCQLWEELYQLERTGPNTFVQPGHEPPPNSPTAQSRIGGRAMIQAAALSLWRDIDITTIHSLKAEFLRLGDPREPVSYEFSSLRDSRNFTTRRVVVEQAGARCAVLTLSFTSQWDGFSHSFVHPPVFPEPESLLEPWQLFPVGPRTRREALPELPIEFRLSGFASQDGGRQPGTLLAARIVPGFSDEAAKRAAVRIGTTDNFNLDVCGQYYELPRASQASLDHQVWFHRPVSWDGWHFYETWSDVAAGNRALVEGRIWDEDGNLLATVIQEVNYRREEGSR